MHPSASQQCTVARGNTMLQPTSRDGTAQGTFDQPFSLSNPLAAAQVGSIVATYARERTLGATEANAPAEHPHYGVLCANNPVGRKTVPRD